MSHSRELLEVRPFAFHSIQTRPILPAICRLASACILLLVLSPSKGAPILAGDLVVYRVGDGTATLGPAATPVFLDEFTAAGIPVQSIPLPTTGANSVTAVGNATTEGVLTLSQDKSSLIFTGYRKDAGGTNPSADVPATTNRVIASVGLSGIVNSSTTLTDVSGTIRSANTVNGSSYYIGASTGVRYAAAPGDMVTSVQIDSRNSRQVQLVDNVLYASNGSTAITSKVQSYGTLPTGATTATPLVDLTTADAVNGFSLFDLSPAIPGVDTVYFLSTVENLLRKYTFDGTVWAASGTTGASSAQNITGFSSAGAVQLYLSAPSSLLSLLDTSGYNGALTGSPAVIATATANTAFRGVGIIAIPEPSCALLFGSAMLVLVGRRSSNRGRGFR